MTKITNLDEVATAPATVIIATRPQPNNEEHQARNSYHCRHLKVKVHQEEEFVIAGYTAPAGTRVGFGALLLGAYSGRQLVFVGKVGTDFSRTTLRSLHRQFQPLIRKTPSLVDPPREAGLTHLAPKLVAQIAFEEWTADRKLRQPMFLGLRDDKLPEDCRMPEAKSVKSSTAAS